MQIFHERRGTKTNLGGSTKQNNQYPKDNNKNRPGEQEVLQKKKTGKLSRGGGNNPKKQRPETNLLYALRQKGRERVDAKRTH